MAVALLFIAGLMAIAAACRDSDSEPETKREYYTKETHLTHYPDGKIEKEEER